MALFLDDGVSGVSVVFDEPILDLRFYGAEGILWGAHGLQDRLTTKQHERVTVFFRISGPKPPSTR